ncbi:MAG TPA: hydroxyacid dehydrogenase [Candidatus Latescibacteria bacterium]|nr:hydroxyacid dehydrogenase [Candidatus Handelsmanbacteria bacterium]HIL09669.1 hydroxyacid dehydrogenase [Candidatus Latescibacterota bacterium]
MSEKKFNVLVSDRSIHPSGIDLLRHSAELTFLEGYARPAVFAAAVSEADAIFCRSGIVDASVIDAASKLKIVSRHGVGYDNVDIAACTRRGIVVTTTGEANSQSVSELAIGMMLYLGRFIRRANADMDAGLWERTSLMGTELFQKTLGIIGLGRVGTRLAKHANGFDMELLVCDPYLDADTVAKHGAKQVDLQTLLAQSDYVSLHLPLNSETRHIIGAQELSQMRESAILINCARGGIVDEDALYTALVEQQIAGAGIDVFEKEPLPAGHPLIGLDNVCHSPHIAGQTAESLVRVSLQTAENILTVLRGEKLDPGFAVNPEALTD